MSATREGLGPPRRWMELRGAAAAVAFLTRIPVEGALTLDGDDVARAGPAFPLVGAAVGAVVGGIAALLATALSPLLAAGLALAAGTVLTGALHLDALADTADALGGRSREHALEIMRDHAIGAYGTVAIAIDLLIKAAALSALARSGDVVALSVVAGAISRAVPVPLAAALPYARTGDGTAATLTRAARGRAVAAGVFAALIAVAVRGVTGLALIACAAVITVCLGLAFRQWLGGVTGDALGCAVELSEAVSLIAAVALVGAG